MPKVVSDNLALRAIRSERGMAIKIGQLCGISRVAVCMWKQEVPPRHAVRVARALKMKVHMVCPSMFPPPRKERKPKSSTDN